MLLKGVSEAKEDAVAEVERVFSTFAVIAATVEDITVVEVATWPRVVIEALSVAAFTSMLVIIKLLVVIGLATVMVESANFCSEAVLCD